MRPPLEAEADRGAPGGRGGIGPAPVPAVDEVIRLTGAPVPAVLTVLLELETGRALPPSLRKSGVLGLN